MARPAVIAALALAAFACTATAVEPGTYGCFTRGGTEIPGRRFDVGVPGGYDIPANPRGHRVTFRDSSLKGRQALLLPDGRIRLSPKVFCRKVLDPVPPPPPPEPVAPPQTEDPAPRLIRVEDALGDPRITAVN